MPRKRNQGAHGRPKYNQARKVIARFGGEAKLAAIIGVSRITCYRWGYAAPYGTEGLIPAHQIEKIRSAARREGVLLRPEDWNPEPQRYDINSEGEQVVVTRNGLRDRQKVVAKPSLADLLA